MEDECLGELICIVNKTDSEKSIATTNAYSLECTEGSRSSGKESQSSGKQSRSSDKESQSSDKESRSSDKKSRSSGKESQSSDKQSRRTYVLAADSGSDSASPSPSPSSSPTRARPALLYDAISLKSTSNVSQSQKFTIDAADTIQEEGFADASDELPECEAINGDPDTAQLLIEYSLHAQETFTQTSKTILELAQTNCVKCFTDINAIETQTSRVSIFENKTIEYRIEVTGSQTRFTRNEIPSGVSGRAGARLSLAGPCHSRGGSDDSGTLRIIDDESETKSIEEIEKSDLSDNNTSKYDTDFTDSLEDDRTRHDDNSDGSVPKSVDRDVEELYTNLEKSFDLRSFDRPQFDTPRYVALSTLSEETMKESSVSRRDSTRTQPKESPHRHSITTPELRRNQLSAEGESKEQWRLPPIGRAERGGSPRRRPYSPGARAPPARASRDHARADATSDLAAGEHANLATRIGFVAPADPHRLPSLVGRAPASRGDGAPTPAPRSPRACSPDTISIGGKIQQLKMPSADKKRLLHQFSSTSSPDSRSSSPGSAHSRWAGAGAGAAGADVAARGCDALCADVIARLRQACSSTRMTFEQHVSRYESSDRCGAKWAAAVEVLEDIPRLFRGFWPAVPEHRLADLLRLVAAQVESPRTRVARAACAALAALLSHTGYTKRPDFDEALAALLGKTGSMASALRRAANLALDQVVAAAATAPAVTSLCLYGADHKSGLVRCAAARLLVVAAALAAGGRGLLRARPRSAAHARRLLLRSLAALLDDRSLDARKYAERLYALLRPLPGFEAFFLADVEARAACRLMKKLDPLLAAVPRR
ncbi:uncharacterized protein LOC133515689 isoform X2 [Cydia pomonella]|uniref:uncharacterized protein LOC133515689 isoform X2 n=1 Tax=Cydia pomonella TaxID=82600 RepID=UPI002ADD6DBA|nr:uncharacterized protein LOC133515689 isoform X2 [Cydia pomonella]